MIVQTAPAGQDRTVIRNVDHAVAAGEFARAFGNADFAPLEPAGLIAFVSANHEEGWRALDDRPERDPATGLPYHLAGSPQRILVRKSIDSPAFNEAHHPYCGLLSSMHNWGLYNGRYGLSDKISITDIPAEDRAAVQAMLDGEEARQGRLRGRLADEPRTAAWVEEERLFTGYKLLEFFDTLALYLQLRDHTQWEEEVFLNVPAGVGEDVDVTVRPVDERTITLTPYPFASDRLELTCAGRAVAPQGSDEELRAALAAAPSSLQCSFVVKA